ncbi:hypothetical protein M8C21_005028 [Ambrosia artemisiifolia]|uniref:Uncharacterized protein n=1 Tax=Ambrosia artemisiifolia TaxID=4212 RepID=A0AAD5G8Y2_AMBAR|nr:hypothetical protein M8C21_005028 [Ambrosia artemisiifolia]
MESPSKSKVEVIKQAIKQVIEDGGSDDDRLLSKLLYQLDGEPKPNSAFSNSRSSSDEDDDDEEEKERILKELKKVRRQNRMIKPRQPHNHRHHHNDTLISEAPNLIEPTPVHDLKLTKLPHLEPPKIDLGFTNDQD